MSFISAPRPQPRSQRSPVLFQILAAFFGGLVLFWVAASAISSGYQLLFSGRVLPGISMAGVDLSSLTPEQASTALNQRMTYPINGRIVFHDGDTAWVATPAQLGMVFDAGTSVQRAYGVGRQDGAFDNLSNQLDAWQGGLYLTPVIIYDARVAHDYLQSIAAQIDRPMIEADLHLDGTQVFYRPGQIGRTLDVDKTLTALLAQLKTFQDGEIALVVEEQAPAILDASSQAGTLRQALSAPLVLKVANAQPGDPGPWTIDPSVLAGMLAVGRVETDSGWQYQISVDTQAIEQFLGQIAPKINQSSQNARFHFNSGQLVPIPAYPSQTGRTLDVAASRAAIVQKLLQGAHAIPLVIPIAQPAVPDNATAASLGITGLVSSNTSYFRFSSQARMQNIKTAAARFDGLLIPPNTTFSMGAAMGDISLDNGYAEALIIYNGQTILGVGGGVCQVSTTLFRTAYFGGYPIVERHEHAYRVRYYEQTATGYDNSLAGLDATVYFPLVDLKFTNDRPYWLLMETYYNSDNSSLTWNFYSTDDGRTVDVKNLGLQNVVTSPDPVFEENPGLAAGEISQDDWWYEDGADITVTRVVTRNGQVIISDTTQTHYDPHPLTCQYGPGTDDPQAVAAQQGLCQQ